MPDAIAIRAARKDDAAEFVIPADGSPHGLAWWFRYGAVLNGSKATAFGEARCPMRSGTQAAARRGRRRLAREAARADGRPVGLIAESDNETAPGLYKSRGFAEVTQRQAVSLTENGRQHDRVLPTRSAA